MCTMTWFVNESGYELFFNRDERVSRRHAELPQVYEKEGMSYISPTDADAGGTWIAVNNHGVTVCLLNHYQFEQIATYKKWTSRGEIVRQFATTKELATAELEFSRLELEDYRAFRMFIIDRSGHNRLFVWDGHQGRIETEVQSPKSSSSVDAKHVKALRKELFKKRGIPMSVNPKDYIDFHSSHEPSKSQESVCMHRDDANTVSFSNVKVSSTCVSFRYADGPPCEAELGAPILLPIQESDDSSNPQKMNQFVQRHK